ncbi:MAG: hypothetical protein R3F38_08685 [Gammaproteobacteria bacterium]
MLCDTACLLQTRGSAGNQGGFTTTSVALGDILRQQLATHAGIEFGIRTVRS